MSTSPVGSTPSYDPAAEAYEPEPVAPAPEVDPAQDPYAPQARADQYVDPATRAVPVGRMRETGGVAPVGAAPASGQEIVDNAASYTGTPYNYPWDRSYTGGGTGPAGLGLQAADGSIDCSQLTSLAYGG